MHSVKHFLFYLLLFLSGILYIPHIHVVFYKLYTSYILVHIFLLFIFLFFLFSVNTIQNTILIIPRFKICDALGFKSLGWLTHTRHIFRSFDRVLIINKKKRFWAQIKQALQMRWWKRGIRKKEETKRKSKPQASVWKALTCLWLDPFHKGELWWADAPACNEYHQQHRNSSYAPLKWYKGYVNRCFVV